MTELLYMNDSYLKEFDAKVIKVTDEGIVLDKTAFYPQGGGQPTDTGKIIKDDKEFLVEKVKKVEGDIIHFLKGDDWKSVIKEGDTVKGIIDWDRRYLLMRMHTAAHVISSIFNKRAGALITGNQLDLEKSRIDFNLEDFDREKILTFVGEANKLMAEGREVTISYLPRDEALKHRHSTSVFTSDLGVECRLCSRTTRKVFAEKSCHQSIEWWFLTDPELVKLASVLPPSVKELRIVKIGNIDRQCDGGTHVKNTNEVGEVEIISMENKGKNNRRVYYKLK